jgi:acyl-CoA thioester hydrolase
MSRRLPRTPPGRRADYRHFEEITTRWHDNDIYGHVNNVVYYAWFDSAVNGFLVRRGLLSLSESSIVGIVAENSCRYHTSISFPEKISVGIRVAHLGTSAVRYELGIFRDGDESAAAEGHFVHVYVARATMRPVAMPDAVRAALSDLLVET